MTNLELEEDGIEDLWWEHKRHDQPVEHCSLCFEEGEEIGIEKRIEEAEQADRSFYEALEKEEI